MIAAPHPRLHECIIRMGDAFGGAFYQVAAFNTMLRKQRQEQKAERIAREAERLQRHKKRGNWV